jgi:exodeoxyribonuclease-3
VLTLNIGSAAAPRAASIDTWLADQRADVIVLTETSGGDGTQVLRAGLESRGYAVHGVTPRGDRGALVASKLAVVESIDTCLDVSLPHRACGVMLDTDPQIAVFGVYVPSRDRSTIKVERKRAFIDSLLTGLRALPDDVRSRCLLVGDYNVVSRDHDPPKRGYFPYEYAMLEELDAMNLRAAHELLGAPHPHSWIGRTGAGYLYDYVHVGEALHRQLRSCHYLHEVREQRLSDHAAVRATWRLG